MIIKNVGKFEDKLINGTEHVIHFCISIAILYNFAV